MTFGKGLASALEFIPGPQSTHFSYESVGFGVRELVARCLQKWTPNSREPERGESSVMA